MAPLLSSLLASSHVGLQAAFDADWQAGRITADSYRNGTEDGALAYKLLIQTGSKKEPFNYSQVSPHAATDTVTQSTWILLGCCSSSLHHSF